MIKKIFKLSIIASFVTLLTIACAASKPIEVKFRPEAGPIINKTVHLKVIDKTGDLVGPNAMAKEMFLASQGGQMAINSQLPSGANVYLSNVNKTRLVEEAVKQRLYLHNVQVNPSPAAGQANVVVEIKKMNIDIIEKDFVADVELSGAIYTSMKRMHTFNTSGNSRKLNLIGESAAGTVLGDSLNSAINSINFSVLSEF